MTQLTVTEARAILPEILDRVEAGEEISITRHGRTVAVMVRPEALRSRRAEATIERARQLGDLLRSARDRPLAPAAIPAERADAMVADVRADRDRS